MTKLGFEHLQRRDLWQTVPTCAGGYQMARQHHVCWVTNWFTIIAVACGLMWTLTDARCKVFLGIVQRGRAAELPGSKGLRIQLMTFQDSPVAGINTTDRAPYGALQHADS